MTSDPHIDRWAQEQRERLIKARERASIAITSDKNEDRAALVLVMELCEVILGQMDLTQDIDRALAAYMSHPTAGAMVLSPDKAKDFLSRIVGEDKPDDDDLTPNPKSAKPGQYL